MKRRSIPKRNWKKYGLAYFGHAALGLLSAGLVYSPNNNVAGMGVLLVFLYCFYQLVEFLRRQDTPARDVKDFMIGFTAFTVAVVVWQTL